MGPVKYEYVLVGDVPCKPVGSVKRVVLEGYIPYATKELASDAAHNAAILHPEIKRIYRRVEKESKMTLERLPKDMQDGA